MCGVKKTVDRVTEFCIPGAFLVTLRAPSDLLRKYNRKRIYIRITGGWGPLLHNVGVKISFGDTISSCSGHVSLGL